MRSIYPMLPTVTRALEADGSPPASTLDVAERARKLDIPGRSRIGKAELKRAVVRAPS
jgi:hypothetical protein